MKWTESEIKANRMIYKTSQPPMVVLDCLETPISKLFNHNKELQLQWIKKAIEDGILQSKYYGFDNGSGFCPTTVYIVKRIKGDQLKMFTS